MKLTLSLTVSIEQQQQDLRTEQVSDNEEEPGQISTSEETKPTAEEPGEMFVLFVTLFRQKVYNHVEKSQFIHFSIKSLCPEEFRWFMLMLTITNPDMLPTKMTWRNSDI